VATSALFSIVIFSMIRHTIDETSPQAHEHVLTAKDRERRLGPFRAGGHSMLSHPWVSPTATQCAPLRGARPETSPALLL
jgi:hypothetical protein